MKRILFLSIILLLSLNLIGCAQQASYKKYQNALEKAKESKFDASEKILFSLIKNSNNSPLIQLYYFTLDSVLMEEGNNLSRSLGLKNEDKVNNKEKNRWKYSSSIVWGSKKINKILKPILNKRISVLEDYIQRFPDGVFKYYFSDELLFLYSKKDVEKVIKTADLLTGAPSLKYKLNGYLFLSGIYHEKKDYEKALKYYDKIIIIKNDSSKSTVSLMNQADCYYRMNKYKNAIDILKRIRILSKGKIEKKDSAKVQIISKFAKQWLKVIKKEELNPSLPKKTLVYFN